MITIKGRLWEDGGWWRAELSALHVLEKSRSAEVAAESLRRRIEGFDTELDFDIKTTPDGTLMLITDEHVKMALLILRRQLT